MAPIGQDQIQGLKLAIDKHEGQILEHFVSLQVEDTGCTSEGGANAALKILADPQTIAIFATINDGDIYTLGLTIGFRKASEKQGGKIVLDTSINKGETIMHPVLKAIKNAGAQLLFFPLFQPEGNMILLQADKIQY